ncbi:hypothetical protein ACLOJK_038576 [Asimina triloba]
MTFHLSYAFEASISLLVSSRRQRLCLSPPASALLSRAFKASISLLISSRRQRLCLSPPAVALLSRAFEASISLLVSSQLAFRHADLVFSDEI